MPAQTEAALLRLGTLVPRTELATRARQLIADAAPAFLVNHSVRVYAWAVDLARHDRLTFDPEVLYVSCMLHDIGLVPPYDLGGCYEVDGAIAAERLARDLGAPDERAAAISDAIALHNDDTMSPDAAPETVLVWDAAGVDVTGERFTDIDPAIVASVLAAYPRLDFKREFSARFADQASRKPACPAAHLAAQGMLEDVARAPFDS